MRYNLKEVDVPGFTGVAAVDAVAPKLKAGAGVEVAAPNAVPNDISLIESNSPHDGNTIYRARLTISYKRQCNEHGDRYAPRTQIPPYAQTSCHMTQRNILILQTVTIHVTNSLLNRNRVYLTYLFNTIVYSFVLHIFVIAICIYDVLNIRISLKNRSCQFNVSKRRRSR